MTGKTAVERIGSAVVATYVQMESKEPRGGVERETHPRNDPGTRGISGKSRGFCLWEWGGFPVMEIGDERCSMNDRRNYGLDH
jgi:hypothetical protein